MCRGEVEKVRDFAIAGYHPYSWAIFTDDWSYIHWNKGDNEVDTMEMVANFYGGSEQTDHLKAVSGAQTLFEAYQEEETEAKPEEMDAATFHKEAASLDGADQWTCTPTSTSEVPERDELYNRRTDPFQLNNIIDQEPEVAKKMYDTLREFMTELQVMG